MVNNLITLPQAEQDIADAYDWYEDQELGLGDEFLRCVDAFSMLIAVGKYNQPSLVTLRLSSAKPDVITQRLLDVLPQLEEELTQGSALTIDDNSVRIRKLPIR